MREIKIKYVYVLNNIFKNDTTNQLNDIIILKFRNKFSSMLMLLTRILKEELK